MQKIYFLEKSIPFNANDLNLSLISGTEKILINISNELAKDNNLKIKVFNKNINNLKINHVEWYNLNDYKNHEEPDILIVFSDANLFENYKCKKKFLWSHSVQSIEKFIRKKQLLPFLKHKPVLILNGDYHYNNRSLFTSLFGKKILKLAPDDEFINETVQIDKLPEKNSFFISRSSRNLDILINAWKAIFIKSPGSKLFVNPPFNLNSEIKKYSINIREKGSKSDLIKELKLCRVMLIPGHKGEVFCLAAEEARELCIPIVTLGIGSLYERVIHGQTGFIAKNINEFIYYSIQILNDDELYLKLRKNLYKLKNSRSYRDVAKELLKIIDV